MNMGNIIALIKSLGGGGGGSAPSQYVITVVDKTVSGTEYKADKTYAEIKAAVESGMNVILHYKRNSNSKDLSVYYLVTNEDGYYIFSTTYYSSTGTYIYFFDIYEKDGVMSISKERFNLLLKES